MLTTINYNTAFDRYSHRVASSVQLPKYGVEYILKMLWLEIAQLKRGYDPSIVGHMITETRHSRHLREKGFITTVVGGKNNMFRLTRVGIVQANLLLLGGDDRPRFHRSESQLDSMLPTKGKQASRAKILKLMLDWGKSEFDSSSEPAAYPPMSVEQVMSDPPYAEI